MATQNWVIIDSYNGLLPFGTKPLPETMLTWDPKNAPQSNFTEMNMMLATKIAFETGISKFLENLPGAKELTIW